MIKKTVWIETSRLVLGAFPKGSPSLNKSSAFTRNEATACPGSTLARTSFAESYRDHRRKQVSLHPCAPEKVQQRQPQTLDSGWEGSPGTERSRVTASGIEIVVKIISMETRVGCIQIPSWPPHHWDSWQVKPSESPCLDL